MRRLPPVVCVSTADWDAPLWTNKQHLMSRLAERGATVLYLDSLGLRAPTAGSSDLRRIGRRLRAWRPTARPAAQAGVLRDSPLVIPAHGRAWVRAVNRRLLRGRLRRNERRFGLRDAVVWAYAPPALDMYDPRRHRALVYHCVDDVAAFPGVDAAAFREGERRLVAAADVCLASSRPLLAHLERMGARRAVYWPNPADTGAFAAAAPADPASRPVTVGFVGAVQDHKVDVPLVAAAARLRPDWCFALVGPVGEGLGRRDLGATELPPNVVLRGHAAREALPAVMRGFHVGVVPYRINAYTEGVFPMKVFEYLAAGLPVVSTPLPSLVGEVEHVAFAADADELVAAVEAALAAPGDAVDARRAYAGAYSWEARADEAAALLLELAGD
jgi:glycosyltransferase involved in cell wall biosynthesis